MEVEYDGLNRAERDVIYQFKEIYDSQIDRIEATQQTISQLSIRDLMAVQHTETFTSIAVEHSGLNSEEVKRILYMVFDEVYSIDNKFVVKLDKSANVQTDFIESLARLRKLARNEFNQRMCRVTIALKEELYKVTDYVVVGNKGVRLGYMIPLDATTVGAPLKKLASFFAERLPKKPYLWREDRFRFQLVMHDTFIMCFVDMHHKLISHLRRREAKDTQIDLVSSMALESIDCESERSKRIRSTNMYFNQCMIGACSRVPLDFIDGKAFVPRPVFVEQECILTLNI
jgi:hypothetical protein